MTPLDAALLNSPYLIFTGWTLLVIACETTVVAALLAGWGLMRRGGAAAREYTVSLTALAAAVVLSAALAMALAEWPARSGAIRVGGAQSSVAAVPSAIRHGRAVLTNVPAAAASLASRRTPTLDAIAAAAAVVWLFGVALLSVRLLGGWYIARQLAARAEPLADGELLAGATRLAGESGADAPVQLLESAEIEAPVVLGWRRPVLILPHAALLRLAPEQMSTLLVHEFAHVRRRDYLVNALQSLVDAVLFFSPAVLWMSQRVRETREYCCDDEAVARCGTPRPYVEALTTLAALGTLNSARAAQGISGPRLITRVRRLLQEEAMPKFASLRVIALGAALVVLVIASVELSAASAARSPRRSGSARPAFQAGAPYSGFPFGYATEQTGSGLVIKSLRSTIEMPAESATVQNVSTEAVAAIRFIAAVERAGALGRLPVRLFVSDEVPVSIAPGGTADLRPTLLTAKQLDDLAREAGVTHLQFFFGLQSVRFANGYAWSITPNPNATTGSDALNIPKPVYSRALIERDANRAPAPACTDEGGRRTTSHGGVVPILNEPGHVMRCDNGRWVDASAK